MYYNVTDNPIRLLFDRKAISYGRAFVEMKELEKEIKAIDKWFDIFGEHANNLKFFQQDAYQNKLIAKRNELKEKLQMEGK